MLSLKEGNKILLPILELSLLLFKKIISRHDEKLLEDMIIIKITTLPY